MSKQEEKHFKITIVAIHVRLQGTVPDDCLSVVS